MQLVSRKDAKAAGLKRYFTGKPCKHGHVAERTTHNSTCCECLTIAIKTWGQKNRQRVRAGERSRYAANPEKYRAKARVSMAAWRKSNPDKERAKCEAWRAANPEKNAAIKAAWYSANRDKTKARAAAWKRSNPATVLAYANRRRASIFAARCACCTAGDIMRFYANRLPGHHVDHIIPLADGGKHCSKNLQILSESDHMTKTAAENSARPRRKTG